MTDDLTKMESQIFYQDRLEALRHKIQGLFDQYGLGLTLEALTEETCRRTLEDDHEARKIFNVLRACREEHENFEDKQEIVAAAT